jgi:hypothetical protein
MHTSKNHTSEELDDSLNLVCIYADKDNKCCVVTSRTDKDFDHLNFYCSVHRKLIEDAIANDIERDGDEKGGGDDNRSIDESNKSLDNTTIETISSHSDSKLGEEDQLTPPELTPPQLTPPQLTPPELTPPQLTPPELTPPELTPLLAQKGSAKEAAASLGLTKHTKSFKVKCAFKFEQTHNVWMDHSELRSDDTWIFFETKELNALFAKHGTVYYYYDLFTAAFNDKTGQHVICYTVYNSKTSPGELLVMVYLCR